MFRSLCCNQPHSFDIEAADAADLNHSTAHEGHMSCITPVLAACLLLLVSPSFFSRQIRPDSVWSQGSNRRGDLRGASLSVLLPALYLLSLLPADSASLHSLSFSSYLLPSSPLLSSSHASPRRKLLRFPAISLSSIFTPTHMDSSNLYRYPFISSHPGGY